MLGRRAFDWNAHKNITRCPHSKDANLPVVLTFCGFDTVFREDPIDDGVHFFGSCHRYI